MIRKGSEPHGIRKYLYVSGAIHLFIILVIALWRIIGPERPTLRIVEGAVRVDIVGMPTHTLQELKEIAQGEKIEKESDDTDDSETTEKDKQETKEEDEKNALLEVKKESDKRMAFLNSIKKMASQKVKTVAKSNSKQDKKSGIAIGEGEKKNLRELIVAGNKISKGSLLTSDGRGGSRLDQEIDQYATSLPDWVRPHWKLPSYLKDAGFSCAIRIYLDGQGDLIKATFYEKSTNLEYDKRAMDAVKQASPYPKFNSSIGSRLMNGEIVLGFPL